MHLNNSLVGMTTIRTSNLNDTIKKEFENHLNSNTSAFFLFLQVGRWFQLRLDMIASVFCILTVFSSIIGKSKIFNILKLFIY